MTDKTDEEHLNNPTNIQSDNPAGEIIPTKDTEIIKSNQEDENMEVHHHPHVEKKNFKEYFLEFLMIFLAVTMGFFAEQLRETFAERHHESEYMASLRKDLNLDISYLEISINAKERRIKSIDSVLHYFKNTNMLDKVPADLIKTMKTANADAVFISHSGTIEQLTNSGGLRIIHKADLVDSIESYYQQVKRSEYVNNYSSNIQAETNYLFEKLIDVSGLIEDYEYFMKGEPPIDGSHLIMIHKEFLSEYLNRLLFRYDNAAHEIDIDNNLQKKALSLINQIKKEYR